MHGDLTVCKHGYQACGKCDGERVRVERLVYYIRGCFPFEREMPSDYYVSVQDLGPNLFNHLDDSPPKLRMYFGVHGYNAHLDLESDTQLSHAVYASMWCQVVRRVHGKLAAEWAGMHGLLREWDRTRERPGPSPVAD